LHRPWNDRTSILIGCNSGANDQSIKKDM